MDMRQTRFGKTFWIGLGSGVALCAMLASSYFVGRWSASSAALVELESSKSIPANRLHPDLPVEWLKATATHGAANIAVCTAAAGEEAEGFFALDFLTGDLKGWVYYPRMQAFGGLFATNVIQYLGTAGGKNPEYLLVSGASASGPTGGQVRAAQSLIYVVDVKLGTFVAFAIPWNRAMENSGVAQMNTLLPVGGDAIRPMTNAGQRKAPALDPNQKANQANPNAVNPPNANPNANPNQVNPNQVPNNQNRKQP